MTTNIEKLYSKAEAYGTQYGKSANVQIEFYSDYSTWANTGLIENGASTDVSKTFAIKFADGQAKASKNALRPSEASIDTYKTDMAKWARPEVYQRLTDIKASALALFKSDDESHIKARKGDKLFPLVNKMATKVKTLVKDKKDVPEITVEFAASCASGKAKDAPTPADLNASAKKHLAEALKAVAKSTLLGAADFERLVAIAGLAGVKYEAPAVVEAPKEELPAPPAAIVIDPAMLAALKAALGL